MQFNSDFIDYLRKHKRLVTPTTQAYFDEIDKVNKLTQAYTDEINKVNKLTNEKSELLELFKRLEEKF